MAFVFHGRVGLNLLKNHFVNINTKRIYSSSTSTSTNRSWTSGIRNKFAVSLGALALGGVGALIYSLDNSVDASGNAVHAPHQHWSHGGLFSAVDRASARRGFEVYKNVCASCHSLQYIAFRNLVGSTHTEAEAKAEAEQITVKDGPNDEGEYYERPGKLSDYFKGPYDNEEAARTANNGAYPPDLSYIVSARKGGENYIFSLLTGYCDPPAGFVVGEGQFFNPYFDGGNISMGQVLFDETVAYSDGTPPTASQLAKDVCTFLKLTSEPEADERKLLLIRVVFILSFLVGISYYIKRHKWSTLKSRKFYYIPKKGDE